MLILAIFGVLYSLGISDYSRRFIALQISCPLLVLSGLAFTLHVMFTRFARAYVKALQSPTPDDLVSLHEASMARAQGKIPDADAILAQCVGLAYVFYGREQQARAALARVRWSERAPLIRAAGVSVQGLIALVCCEDVPRALELMRQVQALSAPGRRVMVSGNSRRYYACNQALADVLSGEASEASLKILRGGSRMQTLPGVQLIAYAGLIVAAQRAGDQAETAELRRELRALAPHFDALLFEQAGQNSSPSTSRRAL